jgi:hypothetical protein
VRALTAPLPFTGFSGRTDSIVRCLFVTGKGS